MVKSLFDINKDVQKDLNIKRERPAQLMDQNEFNVKFLGFLNAQSLINSKGRRKFQIHEENEWMLKVIFAYLNRSEKDNELTYKLTIDKNEIVQTLDLDKGLTILGNFGIGKTLLMQCIYENKVELGLNGFFASSKEIFYCEKKELTNLIGRPEKNLFIDDLGDEPLKAVNYGQEETPVASVVKSKLDAWERYTETPKLFITSNCGITKLKEIYGGRIISRLYGATNVLISRQKIDYRKV